MIPIIARTRERLHDVITVWENDDYSIAATATATLPTIWTEYGRAIPNERTAPNLAGTSSLIIANSKKLKIHLWLPWQLSLFVRFQIYEALDIGETFRLMAIHDVTTQMSVFSHTASNDLVRITATNKSPLLFTGGKIHLTAEL